MRHIKAWLYRRGFRPKLGSVFHSPSLDIVYAFKAVNWEVALTPCGTCGEGPPEGECPQSKRPCGHHCNHVWDDGACHWCGKVFGEGE